MDKPNTNLLPCAHCGSKDVHLCRTYDAEAKTMCWYVECYECGIRTNTYPEEAYSHDEYTEVLTAVDDAISCAVESWNKRANCTNCETCTSADPSFEDELKHLYSFVERTVDRMKCFSKDGNFSLGNKEDK